MAFGRQSCLQLIKKLSDKGVAFTRYLKDLPIKKILCSCIAKMY